MDALDHVHVHPVWILFRCLRKEKVTARAATRITVSLSSVHCSLVPLLRHVIFTKIVGGCYHASARSYSTGLDDVLGVAKIVGGCYHGTRPTIGS